MKTSFSISLRGTFPIFVLLLFCILLTAGCGKKVSVTGRVTFPDGKPLTTGSVIFETATYQVSGTIGTDGSYALGEINPGDKILPGEYKVRVAASTGGGSDGAPLVNLIHPKYSNTATSELTCTVEGSTKFDITVTLPD